MARLLHRNIGAGQALKFFSGRNARCPAGGGFSGLR
jgi:hypothetical protein